MVIRTYRKRKSAGGWRLWMLCILGCLAQKGFSLDEVDVCYHGIMRCVPTKRM